MSVKTTNLKLIKPELTDAADITAMNGNWDIIDEQIGQLQESVKKAQTKTIIQLTTTSQTTVALQLSPLNNNKEYRYTYTNGLPELTLTLNSSNSFTDDSEFHISVIFKSGTTATTITNTAGVYFTGDDCDSGVLTPVASKVYEIGIWWNGLSLQGVVRGV